MAESINRPWILPMQMICSKLTSIKHRAESIIRMRAEDICTIITAHDLKTRIPKGQLPSQFKCITSKDLEIGEGIVLQVFQVPIWTTTTCKINNNNIRRVCNVVWFTRIPRHQWIATVFTVKLPYSMRDHLADIKSNFPLRCNKTRNQLEYLILEVSIRKSAHQGQLAEKSMAQNFQLEPILARVHNK